MVGHIGQFVTKMSLKRLSLQFLKVACSENYMLHILGIQKTDMTNQNSMLGAFHLRPDRSDWLEVTKKLESAVISPHNREKLPDNIFYEGRF